MQEFNDIRFQISETQALLDLFNKANKTNFILSEFTVSNTKAFESNTTIPEGQSNTSSNLVLRRNDVTIFDDTIQHHRLDIAKKIPVSLRYLWDRGQGAVGVLASIRTRLRIQHTNLYTEITTVDTSDGKSFYRVNMKSDNPVWTGSILYEKVSQAEEIARDNETNFEPGNPFPPTDPAPSSPLMSQHLLGNEMDIVFPTPVLAWTVEHLLDGYPEVICLDQANNELYGQISYPSKFVVVVTWATPQSGKAILR